MDGAEQWALAAFLTHLQACTQPDSPAPHDQRMQNLARRADTVAWPRIAPASTDAAATTLRIAGPANFAFLVPAFANLRDWGILGWAAPDGHGLCQFVDGHKPHHPQRF